MEKADRKGAVHGTLRPKWFAPAAALLVLGALGGLLTGYDALKQTVPNASLGWGGVGAAVGAVALAAFLGLSSRREFHVDSSTISLRVGFGKPVEIKWAEPHDYYYRAVSGSSTPSVEKATLETPDGRRIDVDDSKLPNFPNANVAGLAERYSAAANLPKIKSRLEEGEDVKFGPVSINGDSLTIAGAAHSVDAGLVLHIKGGLIQVGVDGEWIPTDVSVRAVANYPCLLRLIGQLTHARPPA